MLLVKANYCLFSYSVFLVLEIKLWNWNWTTLEQNATKGDTSSETHYLPLQWQYFIGDLPICNQKGEQAHWSSTDKVPQTRSPPLPLEKSIRGVSTQSPRMGLATQAQGTPRLGCCLRLLTAWQDPKQTQTLTLKRDGMNIYVPKSSTRIWRSKRKNLKGKGSRHERKVQFFWTLFKQGGGGQTHVQKLCCKFCTTQGPFGSIN